MHAWMGTNSILFLCIRTSRDELIALQAKRQLSFLPHKIFLDVDFTKAQLVELKQSREQVTQLGKS
jgi:hypothetical protein